MESPISRDEAYRISSLLGTDTVYDHIIDQLCPKTAMFKDYQKKIKLKGGFKVGGKKHKEMAIKKLKGLLKEAKNFKSSWKLYRLGALSYLEDESFEMFNLLKKPVVSKEIDSILLDLADDIAINGLSSSLFINFIDYFGLQTHANVESIKERASSPSPHALASKIKELIEENRKLRVNIETIGENSSCLKKEYHDVVESVEALRTEHTKITKWKNESNNDCLLELKNKTNSLERQVEELHKNRVQVNKANFSNSEIDYSALISKQEKLGDEIKTVKDTLSKLQQTSGNIEKINDRIDEVVRKIEAPPLSNESNMHLPYPFKKPQPKKKMKTISDEEKFIFHYAKNLEKQAEISTDLVQAFIYHRVFTEMPVIILEQASLFSSWVNTLGWEENVLEYSTSALWTSEENWKAGAHALMAKNENVPRFVMIHNFDLALVDCYLAPFLHAFRNTKTFFPGNKLVLVSSEQDVISEYHDILRYGSCIKALDHKKERSLTTFLEPPKLAFNSSEDIYVPFSTYLSWSTSDRENSQGLKDLWRACQINVPDEQRSLASLLYDSLNDKLSQSEATLASIYHTVKIWSESKFDDEQSASEIYELAQIMTDGKIKY